MEPSPGAWRRVEGDKSAVAATVRSVGPEYSLPRLAPRPDRIPNARGGKR
jgi:hypothetical protein